MKARVTIQNRTATRFRGVSDLPTVSAKIDMPLSHDILGSLPNSAYPSTGLPSGRIATVPEPSVDWSRNKASFLSAAESFEELFSHAWSNGASTSPAETVTKFLSTES
jgi:hypothetical protein